MSVNRQQTMPVKFNRSTRRHDISVLTSLPPGVCVPLAAIPLLREDSMSARLEVNVEMLETNELLMNRVQLRVTAYVVPWLAFERFEGSRDQFDRSYNGQPKVDGGAVVPFFETAAMGTHGSNAVYKHLGLHAKSTDLVNTAYLEAYNLIWNFRAKNRSPEITPRTRLQADLAKAFWNNSRFANVVPDFDQAVIDGEIALNLVSGELALKKAGVAVSSVPVKGIGKNTATGSSSASGVRETGGGVVTYSNSTAATELRFKTDAAGGTAAVDINADLTGVYAELAAGGVAVSLSNLELARQTQAFAKLRQKYEGIDDDWIIDMLMSGLSIPDQALKQPILIADQLVPLSQVKRFATDAANLASSATSGGVRTNISMRVPQLNTGGVVMVIAECVPDQLFERQRDPFFFADSVDDLPDALRDTLDPEKVDVVLNGEIDTAHATPSATFGYAPLNWKWAAFGPRVGGKFYRPTTDGATDDVRKRLWAVENTNPVLSEDFYIVKTIHQKPFLDIVSHPFEATVQGQAAITGITQFGGVLVEATGNYDAVLEEAPTERIVKS